MQTRLLFSSQYLSEHFRVGEIMKKKIILGAFLAAWVASAAAFDVDVEGVHVLSGDSDLPEYELSCVEQRMREGWMTDKEYEEFLYQFQDSDCGTIYKLGDTGIGGGKVFLITDDGRHGLETSPTIIKNVEWGCFWTHIQGTKDGIGEGKANTQKTIEAECSPYFDGNKLATNELAKSRAGGFSDWYVPSREELYRIYEVLGEHRVLEKEVADVFYPAYFWSSYEPFTNFMSVQNLTTGLKVIAHKPLRLSLLPIRSF